MPRFSQESPASGHRSAALAYSPSALFQSRIITANLASLSTLAASMRCRDLLYLFVNSYLDWTPQNNRVCGPVGQRLSCHPNLYDGQPSFLYHNNGDGTFTDVSAAMGISQHIGK